MLVILDKAVGYYAIYQLLSVYIKVHSHVGE